MKKISKILKESPDHVIYNGPDGKDAPSALYFNSNDAYWFGYIDGELEAALEPGEIHSKLRTVYDYSGRIWLDKKVISFWKYPKNNKELQSIVEDLENFYRVHIWDDPEYKIEILIYEDGKRASWQIHSDASTVQYDTENQIPVLIPLQGFDTSKERSEIEFQTQHTVSPLKKKSVNVPMGLGSKKGKIPQSLTKPIGVDERVKLKNLLEYADAIVYNGKRHGLTDEDAYAFGKTYGGEFAVTHATVHSNVGIFASSEVNHPGRLWSSVKVISFWTYPHTKEELFDIIKNLNRYFSKNKINIKIDKTWKLEFPETTENLLKYPEYNHPNQFYIPIDDFDPEIASNPSKYYREERDKQLQKHMASPLQKKSTEIPMGLGSKKGNMPQSLTKPLGVDEDAHVFSTHPMLWEWADQIDLGGQKLSYTDKDSYAFGFKSDSINSASDTNGEFVIGNGVTHDDIGVDTFTKWSGRLWAESQIISFWRYPLNKTELQIVMDLLNNIFNSERINIHVDDSWVIEFPDVSKNVNMIAANYSEKKSVFVYAKDYDYSIVKNPAEYEKRMQQKRLQQHAVSPLKKSRMKVPTGLGSKKMVANMPDWKKQQMLGVAENKMPSLVNLLLEDEIGKVSKQINVTMQIDKTKHAGERLDRNPDLPISESDILDKVYLALPKLSKMVLLGSVNLGDEILIRDGKSDLNIIGALSRKEDIMDLIIITVMRKRDFMPKIGTKVIDI